MKKGITIFDIPKDFIVGDNIPIDIIHSYLHTPCEMKAMLFAVCIQGTVRMTINLSDYVMKSFDFITLTSECIIQIHEVSPDAQFYYACFSREFMENSNLLLTTVRLYPMLTDSPVISQSPDLVDLFIEIFKCLIHVYSFSCILDNKELIKSVFNIFIQGTTELYKNHRRWNNPFPKRSKELCREFVKLAMTHYHTHKNVTFYAESLGVTISHFCSTIKKETGKTALEIITTIVIMAIKGQLKSTDLPIKEIAFSMGFSNMSFFNRYFKRYTGKTPQEYRNSKLVKGL